MAVLLGLTAASSAQPKGVVEARTDEGRLTGWSTWWSPDPDFEGRWWWRESGSGSAWVRVGGLQAGPLVVSAAREGWRSWAPGVDLSTGHWGVGWDGGSWGLWAVQKPELLEAGAQARVTGGPWALAVGSDRTWSLGLPQAGVETWTDRARAGVIYTSEEQRWGLESTALLPASGGLRWWTRGSLQAETGNWQWEASAAGGTDSEREAWSASARAGWQGWTAQLSAGPEDHERIEGGWKGRGLAFQGYGGSRAGFGASARVETEMSRITWFAEAAGDKQTVWTGRGGLGAEGRTPGARWEATWSLAPWYGRAAHTVTAAWREGSMEVEAKWRVERMTLGWLGAASHFDLVLRWKF